MAGNHVLLETIELTQSAASVTFDNIPQSGYTDLKVVVSARGSANNGDRVSDISLKINNDTTASYSYRGLTAKPTTSSADSFSFSASSIFQYIGFGTSADATANTFGSTEFYFPNYTSNVGKSLSVDTVGENNSSTTLLRLIAGLWSPSTQAAISTLTFTLVSGSFVQYSTFSLYGVADVNTTPVTAPLATGGNIVANDGTYWYHAFLTSGTFTPQTELTCDALVVAGGGTGGYNLGGGGGAGGVRLATAQSLSAANYPVVVGAGGAGGFSVSNGSNSVFNSFMSNGGGYGAGTSSALQANSGGSGGGGNHNSSYSTGGAASPTTSPVQGYAGGNGYYAGGPAAFEGGGGGAGGVGGNASNGNGGAGGAGTNAYSTDWTSKVGLGISNYIAGGGGGAVNSTGTAGSGGSGGGGNGGTGTSTPATSGAANTGSGGGGGNNKQSAPAQDYSGSGGSGFIIIRYAMV